MMYQTLQLSNTNMNKFSSHPCQSLNISYSTSWENLMMYYPINSDFKQKILLTGLYKSLGLLVGRICDFRKRL